MESDAATGKWISSNKVVRNREGSNKVPASSSELFALRGDVKLRQPDLLKGVKNCIVIGFDSTLYTSPLPPPNFCPLRGEKAPIFAYGENLSSRIPDNWLPPPLRTFSSNSALEQWYCTPESIINGKIKKSVYRLSCAYYAVRYHIIVLVERNHTPLLEEFINHIYSENTIEGLPQVDPGWLKIVCTPRGNDAFRFKENFLRGLRPVLGNDAHILYVHHDAATLRYLHYLLVKNGILGVWSKPPTCHPVPDSSLSGKSEFISNFSCNLGLRGQLVGIIGPPGCGKTDCCTIFSNQFMGCVRASTDSLRLTEIYRRSGGRFDSTAFREVAQDREFTRRVYAQVELEIQRVLLGGGMCFVDTCNDEELRTKFDNYADTHMFSYMPIIKCSPSESANVIVSPSFFAWIVTNVMKRTHVQNENSTLVGTSLPLVFRVCLYKCLKCVKRIVDAALADGQISGQRPEVVHRSSILYRYTQWWDKSFDSSPDALIIKDMMFRAIRLFNSSRPDTQSVVSGSTLEHRPTIVPPRRRVGLRSDPGGMGRSHSRATNIRVTDRTIAQIIETPMAKPLYVNEETTANEFSIVSSRSNKRRMRLEEVTSQDSVLAIMIRLSANVAKSIPTCVELVNLWKAHLNGLPKSSITSDVTVGFIVPPEVITAFVPKLKETPSNIYPNYVTVCAHTHSNFIYFMSFIGRMVTVDFTYNPMHTSHNNSLQVEIKVHNTLINTMLNSKKYSNLRLTKISVSLEIPSLRRARTVTGKLPLVVF